MISTKKEKYMVKITVEKRKQRREEMMTKKGRETK